MILKGMIIMLKKLFSVLISLFFASSVSPGLAAEGADAAIVFSESSLKTAGSGFEVSGTDLVITSPGTYVLSGECSDGSVTVKKGTSGVTVILSGLDLKSEDGAPMTFNKSTAVTLSAKEGTSNLLSDTEKNNSDSYPDNESAENAVIKCKDGSNTVITGTGKITVTANGKNGIKAGGSTEEDGEASLTLSDVALDINAGVNDAINSECDLLVKSGTLLITAGDDAIHSDGTLTVGEKDGAGPKITISSCYEGLEGANISILSGDISIHSTDDGINAANSDLSGYAFSLDISGGNIYVDAERGDGIDSNGSLTVSGGNLTVFSTSSGANSPLDSDGEFKITGGTVLAVGSSSMAQNPVTGSRNFVTFGSKSSGGFGRPNGEMRPEESGEPKRPDNGNRPEEGGEPKRSDDGNRPDSSGEMKRPDNADSPGKGFSGGFGKNSDGSNLTIKAGDRLSLTSGDETLFSVLAVRGADYVFYSSPELSKDGTYVFSINGEKQSELTVSESFSSNRFPSGGRPESGNAPENNKNNNTANAGSDVIKISILEILKRFFSFGV